MDSFDSSAYAFTCDLFARARRAKKSLPSLIAQVEDAENMLRSPGFEPAAAHAADDGAVPARAARRSAAVVKLHARQAEYEGLLHDCECVIEAMEDAGRGGVDGPVLRYYYLQGMSDSQLHRALAQDGVHYSKSYLPEKRELALVRASAFARGIGLC